MEISLKNISLAEEHPLRNASAEKEAFSSGISKRRPIVFASEGGYTLIVGGNVLVAAKKAGREKLKCVVIPHPNRQERAELIRAEEHLSAAKSPMEIGKALINYRKRENLTQQEISKRTGLSPGTIHHYESLVLSLDPGLGSAMESKMLTFKEARCLADLSTHERQREVAQPFITGKLSSVHVEKVVKWAKLFPEMTVDEIVSAVELNEEPYAEKSSSKRECTESWHTPTEEKTLEEQVIYMAGELEEMLLTHIPEYRRLRMISSLRILDSRLRLALQYLNDGHARRHSSPMPIGDGTLSHV